MLIHVFKVHRAVYPVEHDKYYVDIIAITIATVWYQTLFWNFEHKNH